MGSNERSAGPITLSADHYTAVKAGRSRLEAQLTALLDQFEQDLVNAYTGEAEPDTPGSSHTSPGTPNRDVAKRVVRVRNHDSVRLYSMDDTGSPKSQHSSQVTAPVDGPPEPYYSEASLKSTQPMHLSSDAYIRRSVTKTLHEKGKMTDMLQHYTSAMGWADSATIGNRHGLPALARIVERQAFDVACALMIMLNTIFLGISTHYAAINLGVEQPAVYELVNVLFSIWFSVELLLRWIAEGPCGFLFVAANRLWNLFDCVVVGMDVAEQVTRWAGDDGSRGPSNFTVMRMMRVMRIARALRVVRLMSFFKELRMMVLSVMRSGMSLLWSMVLLFMTIYVFCIYLMQVVTHHLTGDSTADDRLAEFFGSLPKAGYTLFMAVSGGINWKDIADLLIDLHWGHGLVFCFYIFFTFFCLLNIINGIFVETAISSVTNDREEVIQEEMRSENSLIKQLQNIFSQVDAEGRGSITYEQFEQLLLEPKTHALLISMGLELGEAQAVYALLDPNENGEVSIEEFLVGCIRLRGGAKSVDLVTLMYENKKMMESWHRFESFVAVELDRIEKVEEEIVRTLRKEMQAAYLNNCQPSASTTPGVSPDIQRGCTDGGKELQKSSRIVL